MWCHGVLTSATYACTRVVHALVHDDVIIACIHLIDCIDLIRFLRAILLHHCMMKAIMMLRNGVGIERCCSQVCLLFSYVPCLLSCVFIPWLDLVCKVLIHYCCQFRDGFSSRRAWSNLPFRWVCIRDGYIKFISIHRHHYWGPPRPKENAHSSQTRGRAWNCRGFLLFLFTWDACTKAPHTLMFRIRSCPINPEVLSRSWRGRNTVMMLF